MLEEQHGHPQCTWAHCDIQWGKHRCSSLLHVTLNKVIHEHVTMPGTRRQQDQSRKATIVLRAHSELGCSGGCQQWKGISTWHFLLWENLAIPQCRLGHDALQWKYCNGKSSQITNGNNDGDLIHFLLLELV